jgi:type VII secretion-associated serine protease mycosin
MGVRWGATAAAALVMGVATTGSTAQAATLVVGFGDGVAASTEVAALDAAGSPVTGVAIAPIDARVVTVPDRSVAAIERRLRATRGVQYVVRDATVRALWSPNDPRLAEQWAIPKLGVFDAWDRSRGDGATIAVVDTGVDWRHPDLAARMLPGRDFVTGDSDAMDENGHGTHVAGIAAASAGNGAGIAGMAPEARVLPVRVLGANGSGQLSAVAQGIVWAADQGADVINLSLGAPSGAQVLKDAVDYAASKGAFVACASGNDGRSTVNFPAAYPSCFAVGATTPSDARASFSSYGTALDAVAPGTNVLSTWKGGGYQSAQGTSMATPYVAGLAALLAAKGMDRAAIANTITTTAVDLGTKGRDNTFGAGRIDAARALGAPVTTPPPSTPTPTTPAPTTPTPTSPSPTTPTPAPNAAPTCVTATVTLIRMRSFRTTLYCIDPERAKVTDFQLATKPRVGTATLDAATGALTYSAPSTASGTVTFTYTASDGTSRSRPATVTISLR